MRRISSRLRSIPPTTQIESVDGDGIRLLLTALHLRRVERIAEEPQTFVECEHNLPRRLVIAAHIRCRRCSSPALAILAACHTVHVGAP